MRSMVMAGILGGLVMAAPVGAAEITTCFFTGPDKFSGPGYAIPYAPIWCFLGGQHAQEVKGGLKEMYAKGWRLVQVAAIPGGDPDTVAYLEKR